MDDKTFAESAEAIAKIIQTLDGSPYAQGSQKLRRNLLASLEALRKLEVTARIAPKGENL